MDYYVNDWNSLNNYYSPEELNKLLRLLYSQATMWTRAYIVSVFSDMEDIEVVENRLYESGRDLSNLFRVYFSDDISNQFENHIREYYNYFIETVQYLKVNNMDLASESEDKWRSKGVELAQFLSSINPYWELQQFLDLIQDHIDMTKDQIMQRLNKEYALEVYHYDFIEYHSLMIADIISAGIINLFYGN
jgi:hypothetical protein